MNVVSPVDVPLVGSASPAALPGLRMQNMIDRSNHDALLLLRSGVLLFLVALLVVLSFGALAAPRARGALLALAGATKFAPLVLGPLFASYDRRRIRAAPQASRAVRNGQLRQRRRRHG